MHHTASCSEPFVTDQGEHVFPISRVWFPQYAIDEPATGEVRWNAVTGVFFNFQIPTEFGLGFGRFVGTVPETVQVGSVSSITAQAECRVLMPDNVELELYGVRSEPKTSETWGADGFSAGIEISGTAVMAGVDLHRDSPLSHWHDTEGDARFLLPDASPHQWPETVEISYNVPGAIRTTWRCHLEVSQNPLIRLYGGCALGDSRDCTWCVCPDPGEPTAFELNETIENLRAFLSFFAGKRLPILWKDRILDGERLARVYYSTLAMDLEGRETDTSQPVPLRDTVEAISHGHEVVSEIPALWRRFLEVSDTYEFQWILSPLWYAAKAFVDDKLALATVSLERLAASHTSHQKQHSLEREEFLTKEQSKLIRTALIETVDQTASKIGLSSEKLEILKKRINNLPQPPNADKLSAVFTDFGLNLTDQERRAIDTRNVCLHGRRTLKPGGGTSQTGEELERYDTLRMVIHKALLAVLGYTGPFIDYAARPEHGNFPLRYLSEVTLPQTPTQQAGDPSPSDGIL